MLWPHRARALGTARGWERTLPPMGQIVIQRCTDVAVIAGIHQAAVSVAYRPFFPGSPPPTAAELREEWMSALADPTAVALLATVGGHRAGSVLTRADRESSGGELHALHVLPAVWGHGIGSALHDGALDVLAGAGYDTAWLWVLTANDRARRMYERRGWTPRAGITRDYLGVPELRYSRPLPNASVSGRAG
jgi:GNAT superfamily N-acetyltransferase